MKAARVFNILAMIGIVVGVVVFAVTLSSKELIMAALVEYVESAAGGSVPPEYQQVIEMIQTYLVYVSIGALVCYGVAFCIALWATIAAFKLSPKKAPHIFMLIGSILLGGGLFGIIGGICGISGAGKLAKPAE